MAITKPIRFNDEEEKTLLKHAEKYGRNFASYVKDLIIRDMESKQNKIEPVISKEEIKEIIKELLLEQDIDGGSLINDDPTPDDDFTSALKDMGIM